MRLLASKMLKWHLLRAKRKQKTRENNNKKPHIELAILRTVNEWVGLTTTVDEAPSAVSGENGQICISRESNCCTACRRREIITTESRSDMHSGRGAPYWLGRKEPNYQCCHKKALSGSPKKCEHDCKTRDFCLVMVAPPNERQSV